MLIFVKLLCRQKLDLPARFKVYGLEGEVLVMKLYFEVEIGNITSSERMGSVCTKEETVFLGCCRLSVCTCMYTHTARMH